MDVNPKKIIYIMVKWCNDLRFSFYKKVKIITVDFCVMRRRIDN